MSRIRGGSARRQRVRAGAPDRSLTANAGLAVISELCDRLGVIGALDAAVGPVKQRDRGFGAGELLTGIAAAQLAGEDFLTGLDRQRADAAGQQVTPVPGLASTTAAGLARRITPAQWQAVESGLAVVTGRMMSLLPARPARRGDRTAAGCDPGPAHRAATPGEVEKVQAALAAQWETRFADLLADHPDAEAEVAALVKDIKTAVTATDHSVAAAAPHTGRTAALHVAA